MNMQIPPQEGEYLFYFGNAKKPYYAVDTLRFTVQEDQFENQDYYLEDNYTHEATMWWHLPKLHKVEESE
jgi:hypothetical protein